MGLEGGRAGLAKAASSCQTGTLYCRFCGASPGKFMTQNIEGTNSDAHGNRAPYPEKGPDHIPLAAAAGKHTDRLGAIISIGWILSTLVVRWRTILAAGLAGLLIGFIYARVVGEEYVASMTLMPADSDTASGLHSSSLAGLLSGAGLATELPKFLQFQQAIVSAGAASYFEEHYHVLCRLNNKRCNPKTGEWKPRSGLAAALSRTASFITGLPLDMNGRATVGDLATYIRKKVTVDSQRDGVVVVSYSNRDRQFATDFLWQLFKSSDDYIKTADRRSLEKMVSYLQTQLAKTLNPTQRTALDALYLEQQRRLMLTEAGVPYTASMLDPPMAYAETPLPKVILIALLGLIAGMAWALGHAFLKKTDG